MGPAESVVATFGYDAVGRRVWRTTGTTGPAAPVTYFVFVYDGPNVIEEVQGNGDSLPYQVKRHYVWAGSQLVKSKEGILAEEYFHQDRLGSVVLSTKATDTGTIKAGHAVYDPYGLEVTAASWGPDPLTVPYRFAGARLDLTDLNGDNTADNTEFYLMGARWYDPEMGRFLEQDPLGEEGGLNLYAYTGSSPILWVDPSGLRAEPPSSDRIIAEAESTARDKQAEFNDWVAQGDAEAKAREEEEEKKKDPNQKPPTPDKTADGSNNQPSTTGTGDTDKDGTPDAQAGTDTKGTEQSGTGSTSPPSSQTDQGASDPKEMKVSDKGKEFIAKNEGDRSDVYLDTKKNPTAGPPKKKDELPTCFWLFLKNTFWDAILPIDIPTSDVPDGDDLLLETSGAAKGYQIGLEKMAKSAWEDTRGTGKTIRTALRDGYLEKASTTGKLAKGFLAFAANWIIYENLYEEIQAYEEGRCRAIGSSSHN